MLDSFCLFSLWKLASDWSCCSRWVSGSLDGSPVTHNSSTILMSGPVCTQQLETNSSNLEIMRFVIITEHKFVLWEISLPIWCSISLRDIVVGAWWRSNIKTFTTITNIEHFTSWRGCSKLSFCSVKLKGKVVHLRSIFTCNFCLSEEHPLHDIIGDHMDWNLHLRSNDYLGRSWLTPTTHPPLFSVSWL